MPAKPSLIVPTELYFGPGRLADLPDVVAPLGRAVMVVTAPGPLAELGKQVRRQLVEAGLKGHVAPVVDREPTIAVVEAAIAASRESSAEVLIGLGGGSCLDAAKAAAGILPTGRPVAEFFNGLDLPGPALPWVAVPTTAGSGAEVSPNAVLTDPATRVKQSIRSRHLFARAAIVDPLLTLALSPAQSAYSGMDALCHAVEALCSRGANELTEVLALEAARLCQANLSRVVADGGDREARSAMAKGSLLAGLALANARLGAVHGLAHPIGSLYDQPHGLVCGVLLPQIMRYNMQVSHEKYAQLAQIWGVAGAGDVFDRAAAGIRHLIGLGKRLGIPVSLEALGLAEGDFEEIIRQTLPSGSLAANPRPMGREDLMVLLRDNLRVT